MRVHLQRNIIERGTANEMSGQQQVIVSQRKHLIKHEIYLNAKECTVFASLKARPLALTFLRSQPLAVH